MPNYLPPLNALRTFESAARHLSFRQAAEELNVTPAAVSHQVHVLEEFLGIELFERTRKGLTLTPAARACLPKLRESFEAMRESMLQLSHYRDKETLTISSPPSFANRWLMPRLPRFLVHRPDLDVHLISRMHGFGHSWTSSESERDSVYQWAEEVDVVMMLGDGRYPGLEAAAVMPLSVTPMLSPALCSADLLAEPQRLFGLPLLHDDRGLLHGGESFWRRWADSCGLTLPPDADGRHFSHAMFAIEAASDGLGVVASSPALALAALESGRLLAPFAPAEALGVAYHAVVAERAAGRESIRAFLDWVRREADLTAQALGALLPIGPRIP